MTRDDIIRMAREAGVAGVTVWSEKEQAYVLRPELEWFASFVAAAEREECARVCEEQRSIEWVKASMPALIKYEPANLMANKCAAVIRARGE
jgi:hypothetical protein